MVLTNLQRRELHAGIYEYLLSQGPAFDDAAQALAEADPTCVTSHGATHNGTIDENDVSDDASVSSRFSLGGMSIASTSSSAALSRISNTPVLERKWTAVPRLQKKIIELERVIRANRGLGKGINGTSGGMAGSRGIVLTGAVIGDRRMLPRPPCNYELKGHSGVVICVAIHPTSTVAISGSEDGMIKVWDHESGEYIRTFKGHINTVHSVQFTPTGSHFVSSSSDLTIKLWDFINNNCIRTLRGHEHTVSCVSFIPSPTSLLVNNGTGSSNNGHNRSSGNNSTGIDTTQTGTSLLVSASRDKSVKVWDMETGYCQHTINDHNDWVRCVAVRSSDGKVMATAGNDTTIFVYNIEQSGNNQEFGSQQCINFASLNGHEHVIESISFITSTPSSSSSSTTDTNATSDANMKVTETTPSSSSPMKPEAGRVNITDYLASGSRDRTVKLWNIKTQTCIATFAHHKNWVRSVVLHPSGKYILSASDDRTIRVMEISSQRCFRTIDDAHGHFVTSLAMHHSQPILVSGGVDQTVRCWQLD